MQTRHQNQRWAPFAPFTGWRYPLRQKTGALLYSSYRSHEHIRKSRSQTTEGRPPGHLEDSPGPATHLVGDSAPRSIINGSLILWPSWDWIRRTPISTNEPLWEKQLATPLQHSILLTHIFKITAGGDCSHEIKRRLLLGRKGMTNLDHILKSRDITLSTKVHIVGYIVGKTKAMVSPVVMYGCESWTIKKAEHQRIDAFELWCWRRLLRVPWTARRSNQSILKDISPECSLKGLMLKLKLQYFGHLMQRADSLVKTWCWERLKAGGEGDDRGWDGWMASLTQWAWVWSSSRRWWRTGKPGMLQSMGL